LIRVMLEGAFEVAHEHEDLMRAFALNVDYYDPAQPGVICTSAEADAESSRVGRLPARPAGDGLIPAAWTFR
jgi:hypothetical protein